MTLLGTLLGFFMVLLYPLLLILWLSWREHERAALLSAAMPDDGSVRCDGDLVKTEQAFDYTAYLPEWWWNR